MAHFSKPQSIVTMLVALFALLHLTLAFKHRDVHWRQPRTDADMAEIIDNIARNLSVRHQELAKRDIGPYIAINGICSHATVWWGDCDPNGRQSFPRLEIRDMQANNPDQFNLYLIGMERFMAKDHNDQLSYYAIAGIHGRPHRTWNHFPLPLVNEAGFCPHTSTLFGSWHRPYIAIHEQALYLSIVEVIAEFPEDQRDRWYRAAATWRLPIWGWGRDVGNGPYVPTAYRDKFVTVIKPQGQVTIPNPLYSYTFGDTMPQEMGNTPWNNWPTTLRRPVPNPTRSNNNELEARFQSIAVTLRDRIYSVMSSKQPWGFASTEQIGVRTDLSGSGVDSFESIHDVIHVTVGGESGGHMAYLDLSSFEPMFWGHHGNVDFLLDIYHYIVPDSWVANGNIPRPMAQWNPGEPKNAYTPLKPFTSGTYGGYFTSMDVKDTRRFGYYYPETSQQSYQQAVEAVSRLYGGGVRRMTKREDGTDNNTNPYTGQYLGRPYQEGDYNHVLDIVADRYAMSGSYTIHCFIGNGNGNSTSSNSTVPQDTSTAPYGNPTAPYGNSTAPYGNSTRTAYAHYPTPSAQGYFNGTNYDADDDYNPANDFTQTPDYVGAYTLLGHMMKHEGNDSQPVMTRGCLPLTTCLMGKVAAGLLASLKPEDVEPYLAANLYYKITTDHGEVLASDIPNLHISVKCNKVVPPASPDQLADLSAPYQHLPLATAGKPAGRIYVHEPTPMDIVPVDANYYETGYIGSDQPNDNGGNYQSPVTGSNPFGNGGFCPVVQVIKYVYPDGSPARH
ncbi:hypothetical protein ACEQ8H_000953 [Pleosporales sp. CAS-2024a]